MKTLFKSTLVLIIFSTYSPFLKAQSANTALSNLTTPTAINKHLQPGSTDTKNLGSLDKGWMKIYLTGSLFLDGVKFLDNAGTNNTLVGATGNIANTGTANSFIGFGAGLFNTTGSGNSFLGTGAGYFNTTGGANSFFGNQAGYSNTIGYSNAFFGNLSGYTNTTGILNSFFGDGSGLSNTTGSNNSFVGHHAGLNNTSGYQNTFVGEAAGSFNTTGYRNSFFGHQSGYANTTGVYNTANGVLALYLNTTGSDNTAIGVSALYNNITGNSNTANGVSALYSNTSGYSNTANGVLALYSNTTGYANTANGVGALYSNTTGDFNAANGSSALSSNTSGESNTANGAYALYYNTTGVCNVANGTSALSNNTTGSYNTACGRSALGNNTEGESNTSIGDIAGCYNDLNSYCTFVGNDANTSVTLDFINSTALGNNSRITASDEVRIGNSQVLSIGGYTGWTTLPSDSRFKKNVQQDVKGLAFIMKLRPVTYNLDVTGISKFLNEQGKYTPNKVTETNKVNNLEKTPEQQKLIDEGIKQKEQIIYTGFIAQEVEQAAKEVNYDFSGVDAPKNDKDMYGLRYAEFVVPLVKAVQELDSMNNSLQSIVGFLQSENKLLQNQIDKLNEVVLSNNLINGAIELNTQNTKQQAASLGENIPNPFDNSTIIPFKIPADCFNAEIRIVEISTGRSVKTISVTCNQSQLSIEAGTLSSGNYSYSLIVDGKLIDSKKMTLLK